MKAIVQTAPWTERLFERSEYSADPELSLEPFKRADPERTLIILSPCDIEAEQGVNSNKCKLYCSQELQW